MRNLPKFFLITACFLSLGCDKHASNKIRLNIDYDSISQAGEQIKFNFGNGEPVEIIEHGMYGRSVWGVQFNAKSTGYQNGLIVLNTHENTFMVLAPKGYQVAISGNVNGKKVDMEVGISNYSTLGIHKFAQ